MSKAVRDPWGRVGREAVADRIERDSEEISESFAAVSAKLRRGEALEPEDVDQMRRELAAAEYILEAVLEPIADGDEPDHVHAVEVSER